LENHFDRSSVHMSLSVDAPRSSGRVLVALNIVAFSSLYVTYGNSGSKPF
jgi:hypothetical protein